MSSAVLITDMVCSAGQLREREGKATLIVPHISGNGASYNMNLFIKSHIKNYNMAVV